MQFFLLPGRFLLQKHLSVCKKQPRRHFLPLPASSCSHFIFPLLLPRDTAGLLTVVLLTTCCDSASRVVPAGYLSSPKVRVHLDSKGCTLHTHVFLAVPKKGFVMELPAPQNVLSLPFQVLVTATSSPVALQKIILTHLFSFKTLP